VRYTLGEYDDDSVITGYCTQYLFAVAIVYVVGDATGISGAGLYYNKVV
jgi:hypothetical protein